MYFAVPSPHEGRFAIVTIRWAWDAMDAAASGGLCSPDETFAADGEVVWSWRRDPGVYPLRLCGDGNGDNKGRSPGRVRISRKPLRGESRDVSAVPVKSVCILSLLSHTVLRAAVGARLSLRPLFKRGPTNLQSSGEITP
jgi:hypothetical protein